ncbi:hypothetical protein AAHB63_03250 [Bacillus thuringiensis]
MKDAKGKIKVDTVFNSTLKTGEKSVQIAFPLGTMVQPISVPVQVENSKNLFRIYGIICTKKDIFYDT